MQSYRFCFFMNVVLLTYVVKLPVTKFFLIVPYLFYMSSIYKFIFFLRCNEFMLH